MRGTFITLEGPDGSGKSSQARLLFEALKKRGLPVVLTREPGGSPLAERIRGLLLGSENQGLTPRAELLLFEACRQQHVRDLVLPALASGKVVICDRFTDSTLAYQACGRKLDAGEVAWLNRFAAEGVRPDLTLLFDLPEAEGLKRARAAKGASADRMEQSGRAFHGRVRRGFLKLAAKEPRRIRVIPVAGLGPQAVHARAGELVFPFLKRKGYAL